MPITYNIDVAGTPKGLIAIIDIGSNSVRMVVYHALTRVPLPVFNEKYMCALGQGVGRTGRLNPEGVVQAKQAIARFVCMAGKLEVVRLDLLATAAVRDAEDGMDFVKAIERDHHICVKVISGEQEARYAAQGIMASIHAPCGLSADLGGGSLELTNITLNGAKEAVSRPLGSLRLLDAFAQDYAGMQRVLETELAQIDWLMPGAFSTLYAIGGGFRMLAKIQMRAQHYPLDLTHEYVLSAKRMRACAKRVLQMDDEALYALPGLSPKRVMTIRPTAVVMLALLAHTRAKSVVTSVSGIREGFFFDSLNPDKQQEDPLIASATDLAALIGKRGRYAAELFDWTASFCVHEPKAFTRIRRALCILSELAWSIDPNFRPEWAFTRIIQSSLKGLNHAERVMLALALFNRYHGGEKCKMAEVVLLSEYEKYWARMYGLCANLAFQFSGGKAGNLRKTKLFLQDGAPVLEVSDQAKPLRTAMVEKRLDGLGRIFSALESLDT